MDHPLSYLSTHPFLYYKNRGFIGKTLNKYENIPKVIIEDDVWIGCNAVIKQGVHIGKGAVIAAGAVVVKDVSPYTIVGGVPAKVIKQRFTSDIVNDLLKIDWCNWSDEKIKKNIKNMYNSDYFKYLK